MNLDYFVHPIFIRSIHSTGLSVSKIYQRGTQVNSGFALPADCRKKQNYFIFKQKTYDLHVIRAKVLTDYESITTMRILDQITDLDTSAHALVNPHKTKTILATQK